MRFRLVAAPVVAGSKSGEGANWYLASPRKGISRSFEMAKRSPSIDRVTRLTAFGKATSGGSNSGNPATQCARTVKVQEEPNKSPPLADFSTTSNRLHVPKLGKSPASSPKVSTESLNCSRFLEALTGDYFDRRMGAPGGSFGCVEFASVALDKPTCTPVHWSAGCHVIASSHTQFA